MQLTAKCPLGIRLAPPPQQRCRSWITRFLLYCTLFEIKNSSGSDLGFSPTCNLVSHDHHILLLLLLFLSPHIHLLLFGVVDNNTPLLRIRVHLSWQYVDGEGFFFFFPPQTRKHLCDNCVFVFISTITTSLSKLVPVYFDKQVNLQLLTSKWRV